MTKLKMSLAQNFSSFLIEGLEKALRAETDGLQWKFAILSVVQAIELALKERLRRDHPILIYSDIDKPKNTISLPHALDRLMRISKIKITEQDIQAIHCAREWRDMLVHYEFEFSLPTVKKVFARLFGFFFDFSRDHLSQSIRDILPEALWEQALSITGYHQELLARAEQRIQEERIEIDLVWACRQCGSSTFVIQDDICTCYLCDYKDNIRQCDCCSELLYENELVEIYTGNYKGIDAWDYFCKSCADELLRRIEEEYHYHEQE